MPIVKEPVSKFEEPEPGATSGVRARWMIVDWNSVKQLAAIWGLYAATFFVLDATASPRPPCPLPLVALPFHGPCPVGSSGSCFQYVPMGAAMLSAAMLAAIAFLCTGFGSTGLLPWYLFFFAIAFAALSVIFAFRKRIILSGRPEVVPLVEDDQDLDVNEADHDVWNDLLKLFVHHTIAPLLVPALDDSSEFSLGLSCPLR